MNSDTFTTLTARRARLEATRTDLTDRLKGHAAELERLDGQDPTEANVTAFIEAQSEHRDVAQALERVEGQIADLDGELATLEAQRAGEAQLKGIVGATAVYLEEQQALYAVYEEVNAYLRERLDTALEHWFKADNARVRALSIVRQIAPASTVSGSTRQFTPQQEETARQLEQALKARGVDLYEVFERGGIKPPQPFGERITALVADWRNERQYYQEAEVAAKEVAS